MLKNLRFSINNRTPPRIQYFAMKKWFVFAAAACMGLSALPLSACHATAAERSTYDISVSYNAEESLLKGVMAYTFLNDTENEIADLKFNLYGNAYRQGATYRPVSEAYASKAYYDGDSYGSMTVSNVENCAGWTISGEDENILCVNLPAPVYPDDRITVTVTYELQLAKVNHRTGVTENTVNLGNFYPQLCAYTSQGFMEAPYYSCGDPFVSECADYNVSCDLPAGYVAATSGSAGDSATVGERVKCSYTQKNARDFAMVLSDKFQVVTCAATGATVSYYYYDDNSPQVSLSAAAESLKYFAQTFGEYVYPTLSVVQTGFCYGGMEYPALTMISDELDSDGRIYTTVHENAHQWWYAMVGSDQVNCAWQDESLAEYSSLLFFENNPTYAFTRTGMVGAATKSYRAFFSVYNQIFGEADTRMQRGLSEFISEYEYANVCYNKGLILFDTLRTSIGDEKFFAGIRDYYQTNLYKIASPEDLYACFIKSGTDLEGFFDAFVNGKIVI